MHRSIALSLLALLGAARLVLGCEADATSPPPLPAISLGDAGPIDLDEPRPGPPRVDGGFAGPDGDVIRADRFATRVVSFTPGPCAGFGASVMPDIVLGPPAGAGRLKGSLDVVSLGVGGEIVLSFEPNEIVDGAGPDFIVFENAFYAGGNASQPSADLGAVAVSADGVSWREYPCAPATSAPYGACAGWHPVYASPGNGVSPFDPEVAGGEAYDLADVGLSSARFVRIRDLGTATCGSEPRPVNSGFDLDAVAIVHARTP